ncbi:hypothetical protein [Butyrivibrio sp. INlla21]|uniref:hypothetical protein n=1 Tax=Butyrivibrio sp. INlla21 TaxID=1520811 RepID=UPI0008DED157|nr:hypothetical protein [Butyrivibrio sp. INlla21]SFU32123.1 hypothetical protein SAMN02910342_00063 [Butyrivibrio sp. INlla21]
MGLEEKIRNNTTITDRLKKLKSFHNGSYGADIDEAIKAIEVLEEIIGIEKHWAAYGNSVESMIAISEMLTDKQDTEGERLIDFDAKDVDFKSISVENKVFLELLTKRCNELVASGELPIEYMEDWFKKELGLPCSRSEIFNEIRRKLDENN